MKKAVAALLVLIALINLWPACSEEAAQEPTCGWNVLICLCGTDPEAKFQPASQSLAEIANDRLQRWAYGAEGFIPVKMGSGLFILRSK